MADSQKLEGTGIRPDGKRCAILRGHCLTDLRASGQIRHKYGRYGFAGMDGRRLYIYAEPGRSRFPITEVVLHG